MIRHYALSFSKITVFGVSINLLLFTKLSANLLINIIPHHREKVNTIATIL